MRTVFTVLAIGAGLALSGCGSPPAAPPAPAAAKPAGSAQLAADLQRAAGDVDCGPVGGGSPQLVAVAKTTSAGTPGCTEVIDVLTEYLRRAPEESQGTARELTVAGWSCSVADGTTAGCEKAGMTMQAAPAAAPAPTAQPAPNGDVACGPVERVDHQQVNAIAKATPAGTPGCTEVIDVLTEYLRRAPAESQGTARVLEVQGWSCSVADSTSVGCGKDGMTLQTAPIGNQTPTTPLPASAHPRMDGVHGVVDVGLITDIDTSGGAPVLVWDRISFQDCSGQSNCPDNYRTQNYNPLLRRYQVSPTAKVLLSDPDTPSAPARTATVADLKPYIGSGKVFIVAAGPDGTVSTIGQPYLP